jgi:hypothetical protein
VLRHVLLLLLLLLLLLRRRHHSGVWWRRHHARMHAWRRAVPYRPAVLRRPCLLGRGIRGVWR